MRSLTSHSLACALLPTLLACGGAEPPSNTPMGEHVSTAAPALTVVAVRLVAAPGPERPSGGDLASTIDFTTLEVLTDGTISRDGKPTGCKIVSDRVEDATGKTVVKVAPDGTLSFKGTLIDPLLAKFTSDGIVFNAGASITIGDDGVVAMRSPEGTTIPFAAKFASLPPNGRRTAALLVAINGTFREVFGRSSLAELPSKK